MSKNTTEWALEHRSPLQQITDLSNQVTALEQAEHVTETEIDKLIGAISALQPRVKTPALQERLYALLRKLDNVREHNAREQPGSKAPGR